MTLCSPGFRRDKTRLGLEEVLPYLIPEQADYLRDLLNQRPSHDNALQILTFLESQFHKQIEADRSARIQVWKKRMRASDSNQSDWLKKHKKPLVLPLAHDGQTITASIHNRMHAIRTAWSKIYTAHKNGEPSLRAFLSAYGPNLKRSLNSLPDITADF